jgi:hypothetical protein
MSHCGVIGRLVVRVGCRGWCRLRLGLVLGFRVGRQGRGAEAARDVDGRRWGWRRAMRLALAWRWRWAWWPSGKLGIRPRVRSVDSMSSLSGRAAIAM